MTRPPDEVLQDHLDANAGISRATCEPTISENVVVLTKDGVFRGLEGIRSTAATLEQMLPDAEFSYDIVRVDGTVALLSWSGRGSDGAEVCDGADTFVIRDGRIIAQTIHYSKRNAVKATGRPSKPAFSSSGASARTQANRTEG